MKPDFQTHTTMRAIAARFWPLLAAILLATAIVGCAGSNPEPVAVTQVFESTPQIKPAVVSSEQAVVTALQAADTATPSIVPTLRPLPTAPATATATLLPTVAPSETAAAAPTETAATQKAVPGDPAEPTKPPPLPTPSGVYSWTLKVPILMYHYISEPPEDADKYRRDLSVTPLDFERQMSYLAENGFESVDLYDLSLAIAAKKELPEKPVVITFDDGYMDNYENAFPVLQNYGMKATFFVITDFIDEKREGYLNWEAVEEMAGAGMRIESHSKTHPDLSGAEREYVIYEVLGSQETIAAHIGYTPRYFCYPGGRYDQETIDIVQELDFWGAVTTTDGAWHGFENRYEWSRNRMRNTTALAEFADMVNPADTVSGKLSTDN